MRQDTWKLPLALPLPTSMTEWPAEEAGVLPEREKDKTSSFRSGMLLQALVGETEFQPIVVHTQYTKGTQKEGT